MVGGTFDPYSERWRIRVGAKYHPLFLSVFSLPSPLPLPSVSEWWKEGVWNLSLYLDFSAEEWEMEGTSHSPSTSHSWSGRRKVGRTSHPPCPSHLSNGERNFGGTSHPSLSSLKDWVKESWRFFKIVSICFEKNLTVKRFLEFEGQRALKKWEKENGRFLKIVSIVLRIRSIYS